MYISVQDIIEIALTILLVWWFITFIKERERAKELARNWNNMLDSAYGQSRKDHPEEWTPEAIKIRERVVNRALKNLGWK